MTSIRRLRSRHILGGLVVATCIVGLGVPRVLAHQARSAASIQVADSRLTIYPKRTQVHATFSRGIRVAGSISPTIPGRNHVDLVLIAPRVKAPLPRVITFTANMTNMPMKPVEAILRRTSQGYAGTIKLPMFGTYRLRVAFHTAADRYSANTGVTLPLPSL